MNVTKTYAVSEMKLSKPSLPSIAWFCGRYTHYVWSNGFHHWTDLENPPKIGFCFKVLVVSPWCATANRSTPWKHVGEVIHQPLDRCLAECWKLEGPPTAFCALWERHSISENKYSTCQGIIGCTTNSVPVVFIVFSRDCWWLKPINTHYIGLIKEFPIGYVGRGASNYPLNLVEQVS